MKLTMKTAELAQALYHANAVADWKSAMPILAHVLLQADANEVVVSAIDRDTGVSGRYDAQVEIPGAVAVHGWQFYGIVKALPAEEVALSVEEDGGLVVRSGQSKFCLDTTPASEFPALPVCVPDSTVAVATHEIAQLIDRTIYCASTDPTRHNLCGVSVEIEGNSLRFVATDNHRLALAEKALDATVNDRAGLLPASALAALARAIGRKPNGGSVRAGYTAATPGSWTFQLYNTTVVARELPEQFPNYRRAIPTSHNGRAYVYAPALAEALKRLCGVGRGKKERPVSVCFSPDTLTLNRGTAAETLAVPYSGPSLTIGFNARYIIEALMRVPDMATLSIQEDALSPIVIRPLEEEGLLAVIMPMRI